MSASEDTPATGPDRPCGISSILPIGMSCRGRAEAFARNLQSRLRTLGAQSSSTEENGVEQSENTWLSQPEPPVTSLQPLRITTNEADSFFDFDIENESPGSPVDECEYMRLIETAATTPQHIAPESGYVCASPCSTQGSGNSHSSSQSSDTQFYDPENSDGDLKSISTGDYYDCVEGKSKDSPLTTSPTTSSSTLMPNGNVAILIDSDSCSESLPPSQSTESNSTFTARNSNSNSTLQDVTLDLLTHDKYDENDENNDENHDDEADEPNNIEDNAIKEEKVLLNGHVTMPNGTIENLETQISKFELNQQRTLDYLKLINGSAPPSTDNDESNTHESKLRLDIEICKNEVTPDEENEENAGQAEALPTIEEHKREHLSSGDEDDDFSKPQRLRRCSSLKTGKTPPGTPGRKKIVRFADVLGLDLADVRTFMDEVPKVPKQAYEDLEITETPIQQISLGPKAEKVLMPLFQQPGSLSSFLDMVREKQVNLENCAVTDPITLTISGCVRVRNLDFHKSVYVRYSLDSWNSFSDLQATYVENSCDGFSDKFTFVLYGNAIQVGQRIEIAIRFHCKGQQFWDNNYDANYVFQCLPSNVANNVCTRVVIPPRPAGQLLSPDDAWTHTFY